MADNNFQDGYKEESSSKENRLYEEFKTLNESLLKLIYKLSESKRSEEDFFNSYKKDKREEKERRDKEDINEKRKREYGLGSKKTLPEEREINSSKFKIGSSLFLEGLAQNFMETAGLGNLIKGIVQSLGGRTKKEFLEMRDRLYQESEEAILRKYGYYSNKNNQENFNSEFKSQSYYSSKTNKNSKYSKYSNILEFPSSFSGSKSNEEEFNFKSYAPFLSKVADNINYSTQNITAQDVKRVMGNNGIGFIYIGNILEKWLDPTKNDDANKSDDFNLEGLNALKNDSNNNNILGVIASLLTSGVVISALASAIPLILGGAGVIGAFKEFQKAVIDPDKEKSIELLQSEFGLSLDEATTKLEQDSYNATLEGRSLSSSAYTVDWEQKWNNIEEQAKKGDALAMSIWNKVREKAWREPSKADKFFGMTQGMYITDPSSELQSLFTSDKSLSEAIMKYHNGGIVGQKEIIAQAGEVILPISESNYGLETGLLKQTANNGIILNKEFINNSSTNTTKIEELLQQIITTINSSILNAIKQNKPNAGISIPPLEYAKSYRS